MADRAKQVETSAAPTKGAPQKPEPIQQTHASGPGPVFQPHSARVQRRLSGPADILALQQTVGNQAVMRLLDKQRSAVQAKGVEYSEEESVQRLGEGQREPSNAEIHSAAARGVSTPATTLPFLDRIQASFGQHSIGHIKAHVGPEAARASQDMNALAFASGDHVVFGGPPDLHTAAHEAAHVVQQQAGVHLAGGVGCRGDRYECQADQVAEQVVRGNSAKVLLDALTFKAEPPVGCAVQPKLTHFSQIQKPGGSYQWQPHKSKPWNMGSGFHDEGLGAVLSPNVKMASTGTPKNEQLESLEHTITPSYVDDKRTPLREPPPLPSGVRGAYVVPAALLGEPISWNRLYLPTIALSKLQSLQTQMIDLAKRVPGHLGVKTDFSPDGLATQVKFNYWVLDHDGEWKETLSWDVQLNANPKDWNAQSVNDPPKASIMPPEMEEWKTEIVWDPLKAGDGTRVYAKKLGPDHKLGSKVDCKDSKARVTVLNKAAGGGAKDKDKEYVSGHLLNNNLGGPGNLEANLAPIPKWANTLMSSRIEEPAKRIVNKERGWIMYEVKITHAKDGNLYYPSQIKASLAAYDAAGQLLPSMESTINIDAPSQYGQSQNSQTPQVLDKAPGTIATSPMMFDEVILTDEEDLRPFLIGSSELFNLIYGANLNTHIDNLEIIKSWGKIMELLGDYYDSTSTYLNELWTVTRALEVWRQDKLARLYLRGKKVEDLKQTVDAIWREAEKLTKDAKPLLANAAVAVAKLHPSDLFKDPTMLSFARQLIQLFPANKTLLECLESQEATTMPSHFLAYQEEMKDSSAMVPQQEEEFARIYKIRNLDSQSNVPLSQGNISPRRFAEAYDKSVADLYGEMTYGVTFRSERAEKVIESLKVMIGNGMDSRSSELLKIDDLKNNKRVYSILYMIDKIKGTITDDEVINSFVILWRDSLNALAREDSAVADKLYEKLGIQ